MFLFTLLLKLFLIPVLTFGYYNKFDCGLKKKGDLSEIPTYFDKNSHLLDLAGNKIITIDENFFNEFPHLENINLCNNEIITIHYHAFRHLSKLTWLILNKNKIDSLPENLFSHTKNITEISLNCNKLSVLRKNVFANLQYLQIIRLMNNRISTIDNGSFSNLSSLKLVDLSYNKLTYLQINVVDYFNKLKNFALHGNPWNCEQNLCPIMNSVLESKNFQPQCDKEGKYKKWKDLLSDFSPMITVDKAYFIEGDEVKIQCQYCFASKIIWKFNGMEKYSDVMMSEENITSTIILKNVDVSQSGMYSCHVKDCNSCTNTWTYLTVHKKSVVTENKTNIPTITNVSNTESSTDHEEESNKFSYIINEEINSNVSGEIIIEANTKIILNLDNVGSVLPDRNITEDISPEIKQSSVTLFLVITIFVPCVLLILMTAMCTLWSRSDRKKSFTNSQEENNFQPLLFQYISNPVPFPPPDQQHIPMRNNRTNHKHNSESERLEDISQTENRRISNEILGVLVEIPFEENSRRTYNISHHYHFSNNDVETIDR